MFYATLPLNLFPDLTSEALLEVKHCIRSTKIVCNLLLSGLPLQDDISDAAMRLKAKSRQSAHLSFE